MTALVDTLFQLEKYLGLELDSLLPYAEADDLGGYHPDPEQRKWGSGAIWEVEGQTLYALIRALKPETIVEIGSGTGCSATHITSALRDNGHGHMTTVDRGNTPQIPDDLQQYVTIHADDGINYLALQPDASIDFLLEDADHTTPLCAAIGELAKTKLRPGGVLIAHDAVHWAVGAEVRAGYDLAGLDVRTYLTDPSDCGWAVWRRPGEYTHMGTTNSIWRPAADNTMERVDLASGNIIEAMKIATWDIEGDGLAQELAASLADTEPVLQAQEVSKKIVLEVEMHPRLSTPPPHLIAPMPPPARIEGIVLDKTVLQAQEDQRPVKAKRTRKAKAKK